MATTCLFINYETYVICFKVNNDAYDSNKFNIK